MKDYDKFIETIKQDNVEFPLDRLIDRSMYHGNLEVFEEYMRRENHILSGQEKMDALTAIAFSGNVSSLEYFILSKHKTSSFRAKVFDQLNKLS